MQLMGFSYNAHNALAIPYLHLLSPLLLGLGAAAFLGCSPSPYFSFDLLSRFCLATARSFLLSPPFLYLLFNLLIVTLALTSGAFSLLKPKIDLDFTAVAELIDIIHPMKLAFYELDITETSTQTLDLCENDLNCSSHEATVDEEFEAATGCVSLQKSVFRNSSLRIRPESVDDEIFSGACEGKAEFVSSSSSVGIDTSSDSIPLPNNIGKFDDSDDTQSVCAQSTRSYPSPSSGDSIQFDNDSQIWEERSEPDGNAEELISEAMNSAAAVNALEDEENEEECELTAEELNARAEAFITEFRRKLMSTAGDDQG